MHKSSYLRMEYLLQYYSCLLEEREKPIKVLDIGSYDQNGTYKDLFQKERYNYLGLDLSPGPNVDIVPENIYSWKELNSEMFDLVISGQVFEHIAYPWLTMQEIGRVLTPSGVGIIIAPNSGREHKAPMDCYRFFADGLRALAEWAGFYVWHAGVAGVPDIQGTDDWISEWNDATLVIQKPPKSMKAMKEPFPYERRCMIDGTVADNYKNMEIAIFENKRKFSKDKQFIIWGVGKTGKDAFRIIGEKNVYCFADNAADKYETDVCGKRVIDYNEFKKVNKDYNCLIAATYEASAEIAAQLQKDGIEFGTLYPTLI